MISYNQIVALSARSSYSKKVPGSMPGLGSFYVEFAYSPCVCVDSFLMLGLTGCSKLSTASGEDE